jgi:hypothetical protein
MAVRAPGCPPACPAVRQTGRLNRPSLSARPAVCLPFPPSPPRPSQSTQIVHPCPPGRPSESACRFRPLPATFRSARASPAPRVPSPRAPPPARPPAHPFRLTPTPGLRQSPMPDRALAAGTALIGPPSEAVPTMLAHDATARTITPS